MKALVTGAAGFVGSHLTERLLEDGYDVIGVDKFLDNYPRHFKVKNVAASLNRSNFKFLEEDLLKINLKELLKDVAYVFHLAAQPGVRSSWGDEFAQYTQNNVMATQLILEACKESAVKKVIYASSSSVYGDTNDLPMREEGGTRPVSPYGVTKLAAEHLCYLYWKAYAVPAVSLRFFTVYGPRQRPDMFFHIFMERLRRGEEIPLFDDGEQTRDFTYCADIVDGLLSAALYPGTGETFNLGGGTESNLLDVIRIVEAISGRKAKLKKMARQKGDVRHTSARLDLAKTKLGYNPNVTLQEGLAQEWRWIESLTDEK
ncbi:MAG: NAD-dependent epimerase/dehydratase family protein [Pyrinomonadaceae bacterium]